MEYSLHTIKIFMQESIMVRQKKGKHMVRFSGIYGIDREINNHCHPLVRLVVYFILVAGLLGMIPATIVKALIGIFGSGQAYEQSPYLVGLIGVGMVATLWAAWVFARHMRLTYGELRLGQNH